MSVRPGKKNISQYNARKFRNAVPLLSRNMVSRDVKGFLLALPCSPFTNYFLLGLDMRNSNPLSLVCLISLYIHTSMRNHQREYSIQGDFSLRRKKTALSRPTWPSSKCSSGIVTSNRPNQDPQLHVNALNNQMTSNSSSSSPSFLGNAEKCQRHRHIRQPVSSRLSLP